jgi:glycine/D-amino acid oxidase-like deaminating enzyme
MDGTPDGKPAVGRLPGPGDRWVAAGFGGHGLPPALGVTRALAISIMHGHPVPELEPFNPSRFLGEASPC